MKFSLTLSRVFALGIFALMVLLAGLFHEFYDGSIRSILESAQKLGEQACEEISLRVLDYMDQADDTIHQFELQIQYSITKPSEPNSIEKGLFSLLTSDEDLSEVTFTFGKFLGYDQSGDAILSESGKGQVTLSRFIENGKISFRSQRVLEKKGVFHSEYRVIHPDQENDQQPLKRIDPLPSKDPTRHPTFVTPMNKAYSQMSLWSDLYRTQLDAHLPLENQRKAVSLQKAILDRSGKPWGVLRVGLFTDGIDQMTRVERKSLKETPPHCIFICDDKGRLVTRGNVTDLLLELEDAFRVDTGSLPSELQLALKHPHIQRVSKLNPLHSGMFLMNDERYLVTFRRLNEHWMVGVMASENYYLKPLLEKVSRIGVVSVLIGGIMILGGVLIAIVVKKAQSQIICETTKMNRFEFFPSPCHSRFADVHSVLESLEKAKTAMRAMSKYVPVDLVRQLYLLNCEPTLGSKTMEVTLMFTDIQGFTSLSEKLSANQLADALGKYFKVMADVIQEELGTIDKFIGDSVMAFWNAPNPTPDHARRACRTALKCREAVERLFESSDWKDLPRFHTRYGINKDLVKVGHFGSPDRLNYTAVGDGVNLASRLEGLNKEFKTTIIVSENIVQDVGDEFEFRFIDKVQVRGKTQGVKVYELIRRISMDKKEDGFLLNKA